MANHQVAGLALNPEAPSIAKQARKQKQMRFLVRAMVFVVTPLVALGLLATMFSPSNKAGSSDTVSSTQVNDSVGKATASVGLTGWLASIPAPLPNGALISWDGFTVREAPPLPADAPAGQVPPTYVEEVHEFTVTDGISLYDAVVLVHADERAGAKMVGSPTLLPRPILKEASWAGEVPWFGFIAAPSDADIEPAVTAWVDAFASGSPKALKQSTGDPEKAHSYVPIAGAESAKAEVVATGVLAPETDDESAPTWMLARVDVTVEWIETGELKPGEQRSVISYDLLIDGIDTATPRVVSWGGSGTGPSLRAYSVSLNGVKLDEPKNSMSSTSRAQSDTTIETTETS